MMRTGYGTEDNLKLSDLGDVKWMDAIEFTNIGFLQEVNRVFLHPLGLALAILYDDDRPEGWFGVIDYRDEGICFERTDELKDFERYERVARARIDHLPKRTTVFPESIDPPASHLGIQPMNTDMRGKLD